MTTPFLFGYGSILWRQEFKPSRTLSGKLAGYSRMLAQQSTDHRGTQARPGIVATLIRAPDRLVVGKLFEVPQDEFDRVFDILDHREKNGYQLVDVDIDTEDGMLAARTYIAPPDNPWYLGQKPIEALASIVIGAEGPSGSNLDYVLRLYQEAHTLGYVEPELEALLELLWRRQDVRLRASTLGIQCLIAEGC